ncbi:MAG TPA: methionine synthase, partial [Synechococcales bacterium UBA12195]|nr:methionine synthase [Synechococcales bacterium UBA12195]
FADLRFMDALVDAKKGGEWSDTEGFLGAVPEGLGLNGDAHSDSASSDGAASEPTEEKPSLPVSLERSAAVPEEPALEPPFWGTKVLSEQDIDLEEVFGYLDRNALFAGQWQMRKSKDQSREEYEQQLRDKAEPVLQEWLQRARSEKLLTPRVAYGYFPCGRDGNAVVVFDPNDTTRELGRFELPRQRSGNTYCIADFYRDLSSNGEPTDVLPMQAVTMGEKASAFAKELFQADRYSDYLYFHGLGVQMAEALAEWTHARIRAELGFAADEPEALRDVLAQRYRGSRYSFGYPACPNVADSRPQLDWLEADRIGLSMDDSDQLEPEQSTTALVALHSQARYFSA